MGSHRLPSTGYTALCWAGQSHKNIQTIQCHTHTEQYSSDFFSSFLPPSSLDTPRPPGSSDLMAAHLTQAKWLSLSDIMAFIRTTHNRHWQYLKAKYFWDIL